MSSLGLDCGVTDPFTHDHSFGRVTRGDVEAQAGFPSRNAPTRSSDHVPIPGTLLPTAGGSPTGLTSLQSPSSEPLPCTEVSPGHKVWGGCWTATPKLPESHPECLRALLHRLDARAGEVRTGFGGSNRLDETAHLVWQLLGPGRDPRPVGRAASPAAHQPVDGALELLGPWRPARGRHCVPAR